MKKFAIIVDENGKKRVVSSKWLNEKLTKIQWPPYKDQEKILKATLTHEVPTNGWQDYFIRFIKYKGMFILFFCCYFYNVGSWRSD